MEKEFPKKYYEKLELNEFKLNSLLEITKAINNNLSIDMSNIDVNAKSSLPPHMLKSGNIGKVMNSPRIGAPEDKSNDISNMSEFAEI